MARRKVTQKNIQVGDRVKLLVDKASYHRSAPGGWPDIPAGSVGVVASVKVPAVRYVKGKQTYFNCVDFNLGRDERNPVERAACYPTDLEYV